jgi:HEPN domain-containing protein
LEDLITDVACFHCQQAVEKYLKAFLTYHRVGKTHDIVRLLQMCIEIYKQFESMDREKIESLSIFAVEIRYPDDFYMPTIEELNEALKVALKVREIIFRKLKIKDL